MQYIGFANGAIRASQIGLGVMRLKSDGPNAARAQELIETALECGINYFDNAEVYQTEENFRRAAQLDRPGRRERFFIQSKIGYNVSPARASSAIDNSKARILQGVDGVLARLGIDYLDTLLLHRPDTLMEPAEIAEAFRILRAAGKVRFFGVSNFSPNTIQLLRAYTEEAIVANQLQFGLTNATMLDAYFNCNRKNEFGVDYDNGLLDYCRLHGITIQTWGSYQAGWFNGTFIDNPAFESINACLQKYAEQKGVSKMAVYTAWLLRHPAKMQVLAGTTNPDRLRDLCRGADITIDRAEWYDIYLSAGKVIY